MGSQPGSSFLVFDSYEAGGENSLRESGISRLAMSDMVTLHVPVNGIVRVDGRRTVYTRCLPLTEEDEQHKMIRLSALAKANAGVKIGDHVSVRPVRFSHADRILLGEVDYLPTTFGTPDKFVSSFPRFFENYPLNRGYVFAYLPEGKTPLPILVIGVDSDKAMDYGLVTARTVVELIDYQTVKQILPNQPKTQLSPEAVESSTGPQVAYCRSADGFWVSMKLHGKDKKLLGRDFVGHGNKEFVAGSDAGYRLEVKAHTKADPKKLIDFIRLQLGVTLGKAPLAMPPTYASGLLEFEWSSMNVDEESLIAALRVGLEGVRIGR